MNKIVFSYVGNNGHTIIIVNDKVVARDYCLLNSVALMNYIVHDMDFVHADCKIDYEPSNLFACALDKEYDIIINSKAIINSYLFAHANAINKAYVFSMLNIILEYASTKYNVIFKVEWSLNVAEIYGS